MKPKILITDDLHNLLIGQLESLGFYCEFQPGIAPEEIQKIISEFTGLIINSKITVSQELLRKGQNLKFVARAGSGMEIIDREYARERGIACINSPEGNRQAVAEHALGMLLSLMNKIVPANRQVKEKKWIREANRGREIKGKKIAVIGFGNTGSSFTKILSGFDAEVLAHDKYKKGFSNGYIREVSLNEIYKEADVVSIHLPLTDETKDLLNENFFDSFSKPIYFINTSRGKILRTNALLKSLKKGNVRGAALDVLENENLTKMSKSESDIFLKLIDFEEVIITPHIAGWTQESKRKIAETLVKKIAALKLLST